MNNRYICRGKCKDNGEWIEGLFSIGNFAGREYYAIERREKRLLSRISCDSQWTMQPYEVIPETVGQCTGLTDKNGKLIFEGDILESRASENKEDWKRWVAIFSDGSFCFEREIPRKRRYKYEQNLLCADEIELYGLNVIGNICDNPELLEVER